MVNQTDFFISENIIEHIPAEEYFKIDHIIEDVDAFARTTYKSVYVIDYYRQSFLYVSENPLFLCGLTAERVKELGYNFYINHTTPEDLTMLLEINRAGFKFFEKIPNEQRKQYTISYDFQIINKEYRNKSLINHQITALRLTSDGKIWLGLCVASVSSADNSGNIMMLKNKSRDYWEYNRVSQHWEQRLRPELKEIEKDVLKLSAMGYTMNEIADTVNRSVDSVKVYRKNLFEKLGVDNIAEAINYAMNHRLL